MNREGEREIWIERGREMDREGREREMDREGGRDRWIEGEG